MPPRSATATRATNTGSRSRNRRRGWEFHDRATSQDVVPKVPPGLPWRDPHRPLGRAFQPSSPGRSPTRSFHDVSNGSSPGLCTTSAYRLASGKRPRPPHHRSAPRRRTLPTALPASKRSFNRKNLLGKSSSHSLARNPPTMRTSSIPPPLRRIVNDLENVRRTREWLTETRRVVADRFRGIGRGSGLRLPRPGLESARDRPVPDTTHLTLRPTLMLRHDGAGKWAPFLEMKIVSWPRCPQCRPPVVSAPYPMPTQRCAST